MKIITSLTIAVMLLVFTGCNEKKESPVEKKEKIVETEKLSKEVKACLLSGNKLLQVMTIEELTETCKKRIAKKKNAEKYKHVDPFHR